MLFDEEADPWRSLETGRYCFHMIGLSGGPRKLVGFCLWTDRGEAEDSLAGAPLRSPSRMGGTMPKHLSALGGASLLLGRFCDWQHRRRPCRRRSARQFDAQAVADLRRHRRYLRVQGPAGVPRAEPGSRRSTSTPARCRPSPSACPRNRWSTRPPTMPDGRRRLWRRHCATSSAAGRRAGTSSAASRRAGAASISASASA